MGSKQMLIRIGRLGFRTHPSDNVDILFMLLLFFFCAWHCHVYATIPGHLCQIYSFTKTCGCKDLIFITKILLVIQRQIHFLCSKLYRYLITRKSFSYHREGNNHQLPASEMLCNEGRHGLDLIAAWFTGVDMGRCLSCFITWKFLSEQALSAYLCMYERMDRLKWMIRNLCRSQIHSGLIIFL